MVRVVGGESAVDSPSLPRLPPSHLRPPSFSPFPPLHSKFPSFLFFPSSPIPSFLLLLFMNLSLSTATLPLTPSGPPRPRKAVLLFDGLLLDRKVFPFSFFLAVHTPFPVSIFFFLVLRSILLLPFLLLSYARGVLARSLVPS